MRPSATIVWALYLYLYQYKKQACLKRHLTTCYMTTSYITSRVQTNYASIRQHTSAYVSIRQHMTTSYITSQVQTNADLMGKAMTSKDEQIAYLQVLSLLALLVQEYKYWRQRTSRLPTSWYSVYLLYWYKSTNTDVKGRADCLPPGTQFTCFTSTKLQILTSKDEQLAYLQVLSVLVWLVQKYRLYKVWILPQHPLQNCQPPGTQCTCFTSMKVQMLTQELRRRLSAQIWRRTSGECGRSRNYL
jgi:hypothetical protein